MSPSSEELPVAERARALLDEASRCSRGQLKRLAATLDREPGLRAAVVGEGRRRGAQLPDEALTWPAKKLLRLALAREEGARVRTNPIMRDEAFTCAHCGHEVPPMGRTARDHCPRCLRSLHVDVVPGDRAADCGGILDPVRAEQRHGQWVLHYRCRTCGADRVNRALLDGEEPDDWGELGRLAAMELG